MYKFFIHILHTHKHTHTHAHTHIHFNTYVAHIYYINIAYIYQVLYPPPVLSEPYAIHVKIIYIFITHTRTYTHTHLCMLYEYSVYISGIKLPPIPGPSSVVKASDGAQREIADNRSDSEVCTLFTTTQYLIYHEGIRRSAARDC